MTGRFHKGWGDFGGLKPPRPRWSSSASARRPSAARIPSATNSRRVEHAGTATLTASSARSTRNAPPPSQFYAGSGRLPQFGNLCAGYPGLNARETAASDEGAMLMAADQHRDVAMIDERADLSAFELIQLPDTVIITPLLGEKLRAYYEDGGRLLLSYRSGFDAAGDWALDFLPLQHPQPGPRRGAISDLLAHPARRCARRWATPTGSATWQASRWKSARAPGYSSSG